MVSLSTSERVMPSSFMRLDDGVRVKLFELPSTPSSNSTVDAASSASPRRLTLPSYFWKPLVAKLPPRSTAPFEVKFPTLLKPSKEVVSVKLRVRSFPAACTPLAKLADVPANSIAPVRVTLPLKFSAGVEFSSKLRF